MIHYKHPKVILLNHTGLEIAEIASRCSTDSFNKSEYNFIKEFPKWEKDYINSIDKSPLVTNLLKVLHHDSIGEHIVFQFFIDNISRGVLQELVRHRIASYTIKSTRYTMNDLLKGYILIKTIINEDKFEYFKILLNKIDLFAIDKDLSEEYYNFEVQNLWYYLNKIEDIEGFDYFIDNVLSKEAKETVKNILETQMSNTFLQNLRLILNTKNKKNSGDKFKVLVNDNWQTNGVITINFRSFKNFIKLRNSGSAYYPIRALAQEMLNVLPNKYKDLL